MTIPFTYVNSLSSHPPAVLNAIAPSVNSRLSNLSSTKNDFDNAKPIYQDALKHAGFDKKLDFSKPVAPVGNRSTRNRKRKCLWFNPPFNAAVQCNISQLFYNIIERAFPRNHEYLNKLFNKRNLKII